MPRRPATGRAVVTRRAVTDIVRTAVLGSYGVVGFATPDLWGHVVRRLGLGEPGIRVVLDGLRVDVHLRVAYGLPVAEVARQVDSAIRYALLRDLGREPGELTIHVDGLVEREGRATPAGEAGDGPEASAASTGDESDATAADGGSHASGSSAPAEAGGRPGAGGSTPAEHGDPR